MSSFAESSFLIALYFNTNHSEEALQALAEAEGKLVITSLVQFELESAVWQEVFRRRQGDLQCFSQETAQVGLGAFELQLEEGRFAMGELEFSPLLAEATRLTVRHTVHEGIRSMDTLHLAAAKLLGCTEFLTFDKVQRRVARLEGFSVPL
jgi:predicted nucleic acid-binding protein